MNTSDKKPRHSVKGLIVSNQFEFGANDELQIELQARNEDSDYETYYLSQGILQKLSSPEHSKEASNNVTPPNDHTSIKLHSKRSIYPDPETGLDADRDYVIETKSFKQKNSTATSLMVYFNKSRFIRRLQRNIRKTQLLQPLHIELIMDKASETAVFLQNCTKQTTGALVRLVFQNIPNIPKKSTIFQWKSRLASGVDNVIGLAKRTITKIPLIYPEQTGKILWDAFAAGIRIFYFFLIPLEISFNTGLIFNQCFSITIIMILVIIFDLLLRVNTVCYESGVAVMNRWKIFMLQLSQSLLKDALSVSSFLLVGSLTTDASILLLLFFLQFEYVLRTFHQLSDRFLLSQMSQYISTLINLIVALLYILHLFSCVWFYVSDHTNGTTWITARNLTYTPWYFQYLEAFYFATVTTLTIGYGDNVPQNHEEKIVAIFFMLAACIWLSYSVNIVGSIVNDIRQHKDVVALRIRVLNKYMQRKNITYALRYRIKEYLTYLWEKKSESEFDKQEEIIDELSQDLKNALSFEANTALLNNLQLFKKNFSTQFKQSLIPHIKTKLLFPDSQFDLSLGKLNEYNLCLIDMGSIQLMPADTESELRKQLPIVKQGSFLGVNEFIVGRQVESKYIYRSDGFVTLLYLQRSDFIKVLKEFPRDEEEFCNLKQKVEFSSLHLDTACEVCSSKEHQFQACPIINFTFDRELIIKRHTYPTAQKRKEYYRGYNRQSFQGLRDHPMVDEYANLFQEENYDLVAFQMNLQIDYNQDYINKADETLVDIPMESPVRNNETSRKSIRQRESFGIFGGGGNSPRKRIPLTSADQTPSQRDFKSDRLNLQIPFQSKQQSFEMNLYEFPDFKGKTHTVLETDESVTDENPNPFTKQISTQNELRQISDPPEDKNKINLFKPTPPIGLVRKKTFGMSQKQLIHKKQNPIASAGQKHDEQVFVYNQSLQERQKQFIIDYVSNCRLLLQKQRQRNLINLELELLIKQYENQQNPVENDFEVLREYNIFNPQQNMRMVIIKTFQQPRKIRKAAKAEKLREALKKYMFYPMEYIQRYIKAEDHKTSFDVAADTPRKSSSRIQLQRTTQKVPKVSSGFSFYANRMGSSRNIMVKNG